MVILSLGFHCGLIICGPKGRPRPSQEVSGRDIIRLSVTYGRIKFAVQGVATAPGVHTAKVRVVAAHGPGATAGGPPLLCWAGTSGQNDHLKARQGRVSCYLFHVCSVRRSGRVCVHEFACRARLTNGRSNAGGGEAQRAVRSLDCFWFWMLRTVARLWCRSMQRGRARDHKPNKKLDPMCASASGGNALPRRRMSSVTLNDRMLSVSLAMTESQQTLCESGSRIACIRCHGNHHLAKGKRGPVENLLKCALGLITRYVLETQPS